MKLFRSKRGISPLFATIILIVFAVSIGAVLMGWSSKSVIAEEELPVAPIYSIACTDKLIERCCPEEANLAGITPENADISTENIAKYYNGL